MTQMNGLKQAILDSAARVEALLPQVPIALSFEASSKVADQAADGIVNFAWNGQRPTVVGRRDIDWTGKHHHHQEWPAQLNRFFFLLPLSQAYKATGDERYPGAARDYIADWLRAHPTRKDWEKAPYDNTLNLSIRVGQLSRMGWMGTLPAFLASSHFDDAFVQAMLDSIRVQLAYEMAHMPNFMNWRISAADCILAAGLKLDFLPEAGTWRAFGVKVLNDAWHRQVLPDGCHSERNPSYHAWMTRVMTAYCDLGRALPSLGLVMEPERVARMWDYALASTRPNGAFNGLHDCNGERTGAATESRPAPAIRRERDAFRRRWNLPLGEPSTELYLPRSGQVLLRTGWSENDASVTFDASEWGYSHCHLSRNSIQLHAFGQTMLVDPGTLTYERSDPLSAHGKSTRAHNTCTLNNLNQAETNPQNIMVRHGPGYDLVHASYEGGYWEGDYKWGFSHMAKGVFATHVRWMLWIRDLGLVVWDSLQRPPCAPKGETEPPVSMQCNWQFAENAAVDLAADGSRADVNYGNCGLSMLFAYRPAGSQATVFKGSKDPLRGWLPVEGGVAPAPQLVQHLPAMGLYEELVSVLVPWSEGQGKPPVTASVWKSEADRFGRLTLDWADGRKDEIHWAFRLSMMLEPHPDFDTDASLVHIRKEAGGRVVKACAADGTFLAPYVKEPPRKEPGVIAWEA